MNITRREMIAGSVASIASLAIPVKASEKKSSLFVRGEIAMLGVDAKGEEFSRASILSMRNKIRSHETVPISYRGKKIIDGYAIACDLCGNGNSLQVVAAIFDQDFLGSGVDILNNNWWLVPAGRCTVFDHYPPGLISLFDLDYLILTQSPSDKRLFPIHKYK